MTGADPPILLTAIDGTTRGRLPVRALALAAEAEALAHRENLAKARAVALTLRGYIEGEGYQVTDADLDAACRLVQQARHGECIDSIAVAVQSPRGAAEPGARGLRHHSAAEGDIPAVKTTATAPTGAQFFEIERAYPDEDARSLYETLKGLDDHKGKLLLELELLLYPDRLQAWSKRHHKGRVLKLCERMRGRIPLILLEGDVGTGKTALAETIGDVLACKHPLHPVHLLKINTQIRGTGLVGEMTALIVQAFTQAEERARRLGGDPVLLLLDEADALAASRDVHQMHHEDKAGVNTVLQRLDNLRLSRLPIVAMFITNRPDSLDPALRRRAALTLRFERPDDAIRAEILQSAVPELKLTPAVVDRLVSLTGGTEGNGGVPFTASDLTDRLLPAAMRAAYAANRPLTAEDLMEQAESLRATPPFGVSAR